jgi:hypothetical protein
MNRCVPRLCCLAGSLLVMLAGRASADEGIRLREDFPVGYRYQVRTRVELSGSLTVPDAKEPKTLKLRGESVIDYHERVLSLNREGEVRKTLRLVEQADVRRTVAGREQKQSLRRQVRRLVLLRQGHTEVPFSPDGPLTWGELDLIRTDVFTPALAGLLPEPRKVVRKGDRWHASNGAVRELTDMEGLEKGALVCELERVATIEGRRHARVSFRGTVEGTTEDGPSRQKLEGYYFFDLSSGHLSYLYLRGTHSLLDKDGKEVGHIEGRFTLTRQVKRDVPGLSDAALRGLTLEPDAENTRLLYSNPELGVEFTHPRRWRVTGVRGTQVTLEGGGAGILLTREEPARVPTGAQYLAESVDYLRKQKARVTGTARPRKVRASPLLELFWIETEMKGEKALLDYYVTRQKEGGVTLAARLPLPARRTKATDRALAEIRKEVGSLARSIRVIQKKRD